MDRLITSGKQQSTGIGPMRVGGTTHPGSAGPTGSPSLPAGGAGPDIRTGAGGKGPGTFAQAVAETANHLQPTPQSASSAPTTRTPALADSGDGGAPGPRARPDEKGDEAGKESETPLGKSQDLFESNDAVWQSTLAGLAGADVGQLARSGVPERATLPRIAFPVEASASHRMPDPTDLAALQSKPRLIAAAIATETGIATPFGLRSDELADFRAGPAATHDTALRKTGGQSDALAPVRENPQAGVPGLLDKTASPAVEVPFFAGPTPADIAAVIVDAAQGAQTSGDPTRATITPPSFRASPADGKEIRGLQPDTQMRTVPGVAGHGPRAANTDWSKPGDPDMIPPVQGALGRFRSGATSGWNFPLAAAVAVQGEPLHPLDVSPGNRSDLSRFAGAGNTGPSAPYGLSLAPGRDHKTIFQQPDAANKGATSGQATTIPDLRARQPGDSAGRPHAIDEAPRAQPVLDGDRGARELARFANPGPDTPPFARDRAVTGPQQPSDILARSGVTTIALRASGVRVDNPLADTGRVPSGTVVPQDTTIPRPTVLPDDRLARRTGAVAPVQSQPGDVPSNSQRGQVPRSGWVIQEKPAMSADAQDAGVARREAPLPASPAPWRPGLTGLSPAAVEIAPPDRTTASQPGPADTRVDRAGPRSGSAAILSGATETARNNMAAPMPAPGSDRPPQQETAAAQVRFTRDPEDARFEGRASAESARTAPDVAPGRTRAARETPVPLSPRAAELGQDAPRSLGGSAPRPEASQPPIAAFGAKDNVTAPAPLDFVGRLPSRAGDSDTVARVAPVVLSEAGRARSRGATVIEPPSRSYSDPVNAREYLSTTRPIPADLPPGANAPPTAGSQAESLRAPLAAPLATAPTAAVPPVSGRSVAARGDDATWAESPSVKVDDDGQGAAAGTTFVPQAGRRVARHPPGNDADLVRYMAESPTFRPTSDPGRTVRANVAMTRPYTSAAFAAVSAGKGGLAVGQAAVEPGATRPDAVAQDGPTPNAPESRNASATHAGPQLPSAPSAATVVRQLALVGQALGPSPIEVSLSPEELGRVRMTLSPVDQGMVLTIQADRDDTLALLRRNLDLLANDLRDLGFENLTFRFGSGGSSGDSSGQRPGTRDNPGTLSQTALALPDDGGVGRAHATPNDRLDLRL